MKKYFSIILMTLLVSAISIETVGQDTRHDRNHRKDRPRTNTKHEKHDVSSRGSVGAPLDGGLLAILGVAGAAYVAARKKKKNTEV